MAANHMTPTNLSLDHFNSSGHPRRSSISDMTPSDFPPPHAPMMVPRPPGVDGPPYGPPQPPRGLGATHNMMPSNFSRSPPQANTKNTKHVPCKFYRQGACTAGDACPYSHNLEAPSQPCQYFLNGNCKYGAKCALPHIDRNGNLVKPAGHTKSTGRHSLGRSGRSARFHEPNVPSHFPPGPIGLQAPYQPSTSGDFYAPPGNPPQQENPFPMDDTYHSSNHLVPGSSPNIYGRSPHLKGSSALDVTLPASFSSQDAPFKFGPNAASVPSRFGWDPLTSTSPTTSTTRQQTQSHTLGNLDSHARREPDKIDRNKDMATSPPTSNVGTLPRRIMHSDVRSRPQTISASLPVHNLPMGHASSHLDEETLEEDLVPSSLNELLTDKEMVRRLSRGAEDSGVSPRPSLSGFGSPPDSKFGSPKYGSPSHPSRYGALFARQHEHDGELRNSPSAFGHVGSPLRNSSLNAQARESGSSPAFGPISPPDSNSRISGQSSLSEQLRRTRIGSSSKLEASESALTMPATTSSRAVSNGSTISNGSSHGRFDRMPSSSKPAPARIDEEDYLFSMEEDEAHKERSLRKSSESTRSKSYAGLVADSNKTLAGLGVTENGPQSGNKK